MNSQYTVGLNNDEKNHVKVSNAPGGKSNFSLGWGQEDSYDVPKISNKKQFGNQNQQSYNIFGQEPIEKPSIKVNQKPGGESSISFGQDKYSYPDKKEVPPQKSFNQNVQPISQPVHTSVKVRNPPGGKSNFTLG